MSLEEYMTDANHVIKQLKTRHGVQDWDITSMRHHFGWAGYVSRLGSYDTDKITGEILKYRDKEWLDTIDKQNHGRQLHCRTLRTWRWERPLCNFAQFSGAKSWHDIASDKRSWLATLNDMAVWYRTHRA